MGSGSMKHGCSIRTIDSSEFGRLQSQDIHDYRRQAVFREDVENCPQFRAMAEAMKLQEAMMEQLGTLEARRKRAKKLAKRPSKR